MMRLPAVLFVIAAAATIAPRAALAGPDDSFRTVPPPAAFPSDSADSLYRTARQALNDGDYRRAADLFRRIAERYPSSSYAGDALYWQAFALYRRGGTDDLHVALESLQDQKARFPSAATHGDADALVTRIRGELAKRGDSRYAADIRRTADSAVQGCPRDDDDIRIAALNALMQMNAEQALPVLKKVLARRDGCSEALRRKAVFIVAQQKSDESANMLLEAARGDPSVEVRRQAVFWLGQVPGDRAVTLLDSIVRSTKDEDLRDKAIFALSQHPGARASQALHDLITSTTASDDVKARAIFALGNLRGDQGDVTYLKDLFTTLKSDDLKERVLQSIAQGGKDGKWLTGLAADPNQSIELRKKALFWAGQSGVSIADIAQMYGTLKNTELKEQAIFVLSQRSETAATDKLFDIARQDPDPELRKKAVFWLGQRDDPRVRQFLEELVNHDSN
ncbi:MAG: HEAT repeat domain-containing protein [Gemmatimonadaceae bacterium]